MKYLNLAWGWTVGLLIVAPIIILSCGLIGLATVLAGILRMDMRIIKSARKRMRNVWYT